MKLGELVKIRRTQADLSLQDLSDATGLAKSHLHMIERGSTYNIEMMSAIRLSVALGVPVNVLAAAAIESHEKKEGGNHG